MSYCQLPRPLLSRDGSTPAPEFPQVARKTVFIDSRDRDFTVYPTSSQFRVALPEAMRNVRGAVLVSVELPLSYYVFSAARDNTSLTVTRNATTYTVTIPDGNYTTTTMAAALTTALNASFGASVFSVAIDASTLKCTLTATGTVSVDATGAPSGKYTDWGLGYYLGFPRAVVTTGTGSVTGTSVVNLNPESSVFVDVDRLNGADQTALYAAGSAGRRVFAKVPLENNSYQYNMYDKNLSYVELRPQASVIDKLLVALRFHDGTLVDLNGAEWSMTIEFACTLARTSQ